jgi:hypothetical protein
MKATAETPVIRFMVDMTREETDYNIKILKDAGSPLGTVLQQAMSALSGKSNG